LQGGQEEDEINIDSFFLILHIHKDGYGLTRLREEKFRQDFRIFRVDRMEMR
jgi:hypothetical protein